MPLSPKLIATACPYCAVMIADGIGALQQEDAIRTADIVELVAAALKPRAGAATEARAAAG